MRYLAPPQRLFAGVGRPEDHVFDVGCRLQLAQQFPKRGARPLDVAERPMYGPQRIARTLEEERVVDSSPFLDLRQRVGAWLTGPPHSFEGPRRRVKLRRRTVMRERKKLLVQRDPRSHLPQVEPPRFGKIKSCGEVGKRQNFLILACHVSGNPDTEDASDTATPAKPS